MRLEGNKKKIFAAAIIVIPLVLLAAFFVLELRSPGGAEAAEVRIFEVKAGDGFRKIVDGLAVEKLIRSKTAFKVLSLITGSAMDLKPGVYELNSAMTAVDILAELVSGSHKEVEITIPDGANIYDVERELSGAGIIKVGSLVEINSSEQIEGKLLPDTYKFFTNSEVQDVVDKFLNNFNSKIAALLGNDAGGRGISKSDLILASIIQKEVPDFKDQQIIAGILKKRLEVGMPLQVDATICYVKEISAYPKDSSCYPLAALDFKKDSPYNTYLYKGLPPGPIGSPGISAINAALNPEKSSYWFYLSDRSTGKTIFSETLDAHEQNRVKYLGSKK